jgi:hypothetical protein
MVDPTSRKFKTEKDEPNRVAENIENPLPSRTILRTESVDPR